MPIASTPPGSAIGAVHDQIAALGPVIARLDDVARQADELAQLATSGKEGIPNLLRWVDALLRNLQTATRDAPRASPQLPQIARNVEIGTANLPALLTQTQITGAELEALLTQLRGSWLLGGGDNSVPQTAGDAAAAMKAAAVLSLRLASACSSSHQTALDDTMMRQSAHAAGLALSLERPNEAIAQYKLALERARAMTLPP